MKIGNVEIKGKTCLAPMASVADRAYRIICREHGAPYTVSEMISAKGLCYSDRKTEELCTVDEREHPYALQLFGEDPEFCGRAAAMLMKYGADIIDINMGCPVPKIAGNGAGCALMKDIPRAAEIIRAVKENSSLPVTVKMRAGWDSEHINAPLLARAAEEAGAAAITIHGRTRSQMYGGKASLEIIKQVKEAVSIPVIGNGDVDSPRAAEKMLEFTGADLVMIGRGSYGDPWIFKRCEHYLETGELLPLPSLSEKLQVMYRQAEMAAGFKGERMAMAEARRICAFYLHGFKGAAQYRGMCGRLSSLDDLKELVRRIREDMGI